MSRHRSCNPGDDGDAGLTQAEFASRIGRDQSHVSLIEKSQRRLAAALNRKWAGERARVHYLREYYHEDKWSYAFLKSLGIVQIDKTPPPGEAADRASDWRNDIHDDIYYEAQIAVQDPNLIRMRQRQKAGLFSLHGVQLAPVSRTIEIGEKLAKYRAGITAKAFQASQQRLRGS